MSYSKLFNNILADVQNSNLNVFIDIQYNNGLSIKTVKPKKKIHKVYISYYAHNLER